MKKSTSTRIELFFVFAALVLVFCCVCQKRISDKRIHKTQFKTKLLHFSCGKSKFTSAQASGFQNWHENVPIIKIFKPGKRFVILAEHNITWAQFRLISGLEIWESESL